MMRKVMIIIGALVVLSLFTGGTFFRWLGEQSDHIQSETIIKLINYLDETTKQKERKFE